VEDTKSGERNWRRKVFRVRDVLGDVGSIRLKFIASDSIRPGQNMDGGSLVEAAVDDIELWDELDGSRVAELPMADIVSVWPSPADATINVSVRQHGIPGVRIEVLDITGRTVLLPVPLGPGSDVHRFDVSMLSAGQYVVRLRWNGGSTDQRFSIVR
jgi:hypothetical protein